MGLLDEPQGQGQGTKGSAYGGASTEVTRNSGGWKAALQEQCSLMMEELSWLWRFWRVGPCSGFSWVGPASLALALAPAIRAPV